MQTDSRYDDDRLQHLTQQLQGYLQRHNSVWLAVHCAVWKQHLVVLGVHAADTRVDPRQLFALLAEALSAIAVPPLPNYSGQTQLCLKIAGQRSIYATHRLQLRSPQPLPANSAFSRKQETLANFSNPLREGLGVRADSPVRASLGVSADVPSSSYSSPLETKQQVVPNARKNARKKTCPSWLSKRRSQLVKTIIAFPLVLAAAYLLTRPCVVGACPRLQASQETNQQIRQQIRQATTDRQLEQARSQLTTLIKSLQTIPGWSPHHRQAARQLWAYQAQARNLEHLISALDRAFLAQQQSQSSHSLAEWAKLQSLWRGAIQQLVQIPPDSSSYPLAAAKLPSYRAALLEVDRRYAIEQQATEKLAEAKRIAQIAIARQDIAQNPESWQFVKTTWLSAVRQLQAIPENTLAYREAVTLLPSYQQHVANANHWHATETAMATVYKTAATLGQQAKTLEQQQQWSAAQQSWKDAIVHAQKIPAASFYHPQAQALIRAYKTSLAQAE